MKSNFLEVRLKLIKVRFLITLDATVAPKQWTLQKPYFNYNISGETGFQPFLLKYSGFCFSVLTFQENGCSLEWPLMM